MATRAVRCHQLWQSRRQFDRIDDANFGSRQQSPSMPRGETRPIRQNSRKSAHRAARWPPNKRLWPRPFSEYTRGHTGKLRGHRPCLIVNRNRVWVKYAVMHSRDNGSLSRPHHLRESRAISRRHCRFPHTTGLWLTARRSAPDCPQTAGFWVANPRTGAASAEKTPQTARIFELARM